MTAAVPAYNVQNESSESLKLELTVPESFAHHYPFEPHLFRVSTGQVMHYVDEGPKNFIGEEPGQVVVCLHGNPTWSFYFRKLIQQLSRTKRVIAPDHIGCGLSDHPTDAHFRASDRAKHVKELLEKLGIRSYALVMHDWGGPIGTRLACETFSSVERLVYMNTTLTETESLPYIIKRAAHPLTGKFFTKTTKNFLNLTTEFGVVKKLPKEIKEGYLFPYKTRARRTAIWDFVADIPFDAEGPSYYDMLDLAAKLPPFKQKPVFIVWGLKDPCFHRGMLGHVARHFPHASRLELPNASHLVLEDEPQIACEAIEKFLQAPALSLAKPPEAVAAHGEVSPLYESLQSYATSNLNLDAVLTPQFIFNDLFGAPIQYGKTTYGELLSLIHQYERAFAEFGLLESDKVVMLVPPGIEFLALAFACMGRGAIPVFLDPGMGREALVKCIKEVQPKAFIGTPKALLLKRWLKEEFAVLKFAVAATPIWFGKAHSLSFLKRFSDAPLPRSGNVEKTSLIAFTSGGTGTPKGVVYTHEMIRAQLEIFTNQFGYVAGAKDLPLLPIFALFSLPLGVATVIAPINPAKPLAIAPQKVVRVIEDLQITNSFGSPTLWNKIAEYCLRSNRQMPSLKQILMAGAPVSRKVLELAQKMAPGAVVGTPYGATEALPVTWITASDIASMLQPARTGEEGVPVGRPVAGMQVRVIAIDSGLIGTIHESKELGAGEIGEIIVKGPVVSPKYLARIEDNRRSKISDGETFWHRMGDAGYFDSSGVLYFCGRLVHSVLYNEHRYYSVPCETVFNTHPAVRRSALVDLGTERGVGIVVEPFPGKFPQTKEETESLVAELKTIAQGNKLTDGIHEFFLHHAFPVDARHNAKIFRDKLSLWAKKQHVIS